MHKSNNLPASFDNVLVEIKKLFTLIIWITPDYSIPKQRLHIAQKWIAYMWLNIWEKQSIQS